MSGLLEHGHGEKRTISPFYLRRGKSKAHFFMFHLFLCQNGRIQVAIRKDERFR